MTIAAQERVIKNKVKELKSDVDQLERYVKQWERDFRLKEIGNISEACYKAFNELQMFLAKFADKRERDKAQLDCYKRTRDFLAYFESDANEDVVVLMLNNCPPFARLFEHYGDYCSKTERDYEIELDAEKDIRANGKLSQLIRSLRKS